MTEPKEKPGSGDEALAAEIVADGRLKRRAIVYDEDGNVVSDTSLDAEKRAAARAAKAAET